MKSTDHVAPGDDTVLERNVNSLLEKSYDPPVLADKARARMREQLIAKHAVARRASTPLYAIGFGLAAAAAVAVVAGALISKDHPAGVRSQDGREIALADGSTVLLDKGATVDVLGPRRVRVVGAALLDVAPGKGTFVVETKHGTMAVLGTRFVVDAEMLRTVTAVIRGSVRLESRDGKVVLRAGEQGVAEPGRAPTRGPAPRLSHLASWAKDARTKSEGKDVQPVRNGTLFARDPGFRPNSPFPNNEFPLPLAQLTVDAVIDHQVARVALDQTFENPQAQELEGVYRFAIPADAALQRFAMYVDGVLTESAVVERMRARRIYEELVYRRIDPGLLEWAGAGRLSLRVFPLRAQADKRIMLAYTQSLPRLYDDWTMTVPLPEVDGTVDDVKFNVRVKGCAGCELHSPSHEVVVGVDGEDAIVTYQGRAEVIGDSLVLVARDTRKQTQVASHTEGEHRYMTVRARPDLTGTGALGEHRQRSWVIVDDVSASRGPLERRAQADVIDSLLRELDEDDRVAVLTVDAIVREHAALTRVDDVDRKAVHAFVTADEVGGVGATDLGKAFDRAAAILNGVDPRDAFVLYLGDGVVTGGERGLTALRTKLAGKATFVGVGIGDGVDTPTLAALADATGGSVYAMDLADDLAWRSFDLVASLYTSRVTGLAASLHDARGQVIAGEAYLRAGQLGDGEELELVARVPASTQVAAVQLTGRRDGAEWHTRIELAAGLKSDGGYLPRLWAQRHVAALLLAKEDAVVVPPCAKPPCATEDELRSKHREDLRLQVVELGKKFFLLSRHTSLLVLENDAMYAQYGVTKGAGDTWAPYALPAKVEVKKVAAVTTGTPGVDPGASLVRTPIARFYDYSMIYKQQMQMNRRGGWDADMSMPVATATPMGGGRGGMRMLEEARRESSSSGPMALEQGTSGTEDSNKPDDAAEINEKFAEAKAQLSSEADLESGGVAMNGVVATKSSVTTGALARRQSTWMVGAGGKSGTGSGYGHGAGGGRSGRDRNASFHSSLGWAGQQAPYPVAFNHAGDPRLDDLTEFVPAMFPGEVEAAEAELLAAGGTATGSVDTAARTLIERARKALPDGTYKLGDGPSITVTGGSFGWRTVDGNGLEELARFDGVTWRRAYPELGLELVREMGTKAPALVLTYLPLLVPDPDQLATWFVVTTRGPRTLVLAPASDPKRVLLTIELDDHDRVIAIRTASGAEQLAVTWGARGPTEATLAGAKSTIGFTPAIDPVTIPADLVPVALPLAQQAEIEARRSKLATGSAAWRAATRQLLASAAATGDITAQWNGYDALLGNGGVALGDLVLAGRAISIHQDADVAKAIAPFGTDAAARPAPVRYLVAGRAYRKKAKPEVLAPPADTGLTSTLWRHRHVLALITAGKGEAAVTSLEAMGDRAPDLRVIAASLIGQNWNLSAQLKGRAWDAVARGELRNTARYEAARAVYAKGDYAGAAERFATLLAEIDLTAAPVQLDYSVQGAMQNSPRGMAGFDMAWRGYVSRILADGSYDHVVALATSAALMSRAADVDRSLGRAAELATGDRDLLIDVLELAVSLGQTERAAALMPLVLVGDPDPTVERLASQLALNQGKPSEAADHLERAIAADPSAVPLANVRNDFIQLITLRGRVAQLGIGQVKDDAIAALLATSRRWRAIDPANAQIDSVVGELLLDLDRPEEAWRQLSTAIERDPMDGGGWILVADALERHGRYDQALDTWQQALVIDQTNPGPRLRKAQLLYAMGRADEGDAIVKDAAPRKWHDRYAQDAWQLASLAQQRKLVASPTR